MNLMFSGNIEFIRVPEFYHFVSDHLNITIPHDPAEAMKVLGRGISCGD